MSEYRATTTAIVVHRTDADPLSYKATQVQLSGDAEGGYFIQVEQEDQCIELDPEELPHLLEACEQLLRQQSEAING